MLVAQCLPERLDSKKEHLKAERAKTYKLKTAAFREWQHKLHHNDTLPRGPFFQGKKAGKPILNLDECHMSFERPNTAFYPFSPDVEQVGSFVNVLVLKPYGNGYSMLKLNEFGNKD